MRLFVGNLPFTVTGADTGAFIAEAGLKADSVDIMRDRDTGRCRGFGFVEIHSGEYDEQTIIHALQGRKLSGRVLTVSLATPRISGSYRITSTTGIRWFAKAWPRGDESLSFRAPAARISAGGMKAAFCEARYRHRTTRLRLVPQEESCYGPSCAT